VSTDLIAPKPVEEFDPEGFHEYVTSMYALRVMRGQKPAGPAPGLSVSRTKKGALSVRRAPKTRAFDYVLLSEIAALAKVHETNQADLWNMFTKKKYIITRDRMDAERTYAAAKGIPL
jgi:hypothetical protein